MYIPKADGITFFVLPIHMSRSVSPEIKYGWLHMILRKKRNIITVIFLNLYLIEDSFSQNGDVSGAVWGGRHTSYNMLT
jgi:hypothetical protein